MTSIVFAEIPTNKEDLLKTTLTELNKTDPTTYPNKSSYQLEEATDTTGNFVITKYWDDNGTITPVNYNVKFTDVLGDENGDTTYYYKWESTSIRLVSTNYALADVIVMVNGTDNKRIYTGQSGVDILHSFTNCSYSSDEGGAINNYGSIGRITGDFIANYVSYPASTPYGGAICNSGSIANITGNFIGNYAYSSNVSVYGGAIYNTGSITSITGDFIGNYSRSSASYSYGGAIYNKSRIGSITGDFIGNYVSSYSSGGAICNAGIINSITSNFIGNYSTAPDDYKSSLGGAIYNLYGSIIGSITGDFIGNYASHSRYPAAYGGAICNLGTINSITGNFIGNYAFTTSGDGVSGGAICNYGYSGGITIREGSSFTGNYITTDGGVTKTFEAIYNKHIEDDVATINFNTYDTSKSIIVNDGINGDSAGKTSQVLNINKTSSEVSGYGSVEFNSFVNNQTVNVYNGILKLGSFAGAALDVNGTELIVPETKASLSNTDINIKSGAELLIDANVRFSSNSSISMERGGVVKINSGANLTLDETFTFSVNLGSLVGDFELNLIQVNDATALADLLATLKSDDTTSVFSNEQKVYGWTLNQGTGDYSSWIVLAGTVAVPEPAEWAVIFGAVALGFVAYRKRK